MRIVLLAGLAATVLVLGINSYDSGLLKAPALVLTAWLLPVLLLAGALRSAGLTLYRTPADLPVAGFALLSLAGFMLSPVPAHAHQEILRSVSCALMFFAGTQLFETRTHLRQFLRFLTWLAAAVAAFGLLQFFFGERLSLEFYLGTERRVGSTLGNPSFLGGYIVLVCPVLLATALATDQSRATRIFRGTVVAALVVVLLLTRSRSSIVACCLALAGVLLLRPTYVRLRPLLFISAACVSAGIAVLAFFPAVFPSLTGMFDAESGSTLARRVFFWKAGLQAFFASPVWGHGAGSYEPVMLRFRPPDYWTARSEDLAPHAHNEVIETAAELGIAGLFLAGWLLWIVGRAAFLKTKEEGWRSPVAAGILCGLAGLMVDNLTNVSLRQVPVAAMAWLFMGIALSPALEHERQVTRTLHVRIPLWITLLWFSLSALFLLRYLPAEADRFVADRHTITGLLLIGKGESARAVEEYRRAAALDPSAFLARSSLAAELLKLQRLPEALLEAESLRAAYPDYPRTWLISAVALLIGGRLDEAGEAVRKELALRDHPEAYYVEAAIHRARNDTSAERRALLTMLDRCLFGRIGMHANHAATRLTEISGSPGDLRELLARLEKLLVILPADRSLQSQLLLVRRQLAAPAGVSPPAR